MLAQFVRDGIELVIDDSTGDVYYPGYRALARVCSIGLDKLIHPETIRRTIESLVRTVTDLGLERSEVNTPQGLRTVTLIPRKIGTKVIKKHNVDLYEAMAEAGHLVFLHQLIDYKKPQVSLPESPADKVIGLHKALSYFGIDIDNPRYKQGLQDLVLNTLGASLPSTSSEVWLGVAERAGQLGYPTQLVVKHCISLGVYVKKQGLLSRKENRLCNGTMRPINLYELTDELDSTIQDYMSRLPN